MGTSTSVVITTKPGVQFSVIAPGGFRILAAIDQAVVKLGLPAVITSACDGEHSGPDDPHHRGEAYDVRSHDMTEVQKGVFLATVNIILGKDRFYGFLESPGTDNEHFHFQVKKGVPFP